MGRKAMPPVPAPAEVKFNEKAFEQLDSTVNEMRMVDAAALDSFALGQIAGRIQMGLLTRCIADSAVLSQYKLLKKSTTWKNLKNPDGRDIASLDQFCKLAFGRSQRRLQEIASNRNSLGEDSFMLAEQLGLRQVDYNAIKSLPAPEQELVRRAVQDAHSKDDVVSLIEELATRSAKRDEAHAKQLEDERREHAATQKRLEATVKMRDRAEAEAARIATLAPDEQLKELKIEATRQAAGCIAWVKGHLRQALIALQQQDADLTIFSAGLVGQVTRELRALCEEFCLPDLSSAVEDQAAADAEQWYRPDGAN